MSENGSLKILLLAAEVVPFAKTGGLADVVGALPKAFRAPGHDIRVAMPRYGRIDLDQFRLQEVLSPFDVPIHRTTEPARILRGTIDPDIPVYMVDNARYFDR
jgi:starch synthase